MWSIITLQLPKVVYDLQSDLLKFLLPHVWKLHFGQFRISQHLENTGIQLIRLRELDQLLWSQLDQLAVLVAESQRVIVSQGLLFLFLLIHARVPCRFFLPIFFDFIFELAQEINDLLVALNFGEVRGFDSALVLMHDVAVVLGEQFADF